MAVEVKTFDRLRDAVSALGSDSSARFLGGGTLLVRKMNEGKLGASTLVRATDRAFTEIRPSGSRISLGGGVTMSQIIATRELGFLHPVAKAVGGPAIRAMATVGGNLFAPHPFGDFAVALLALEASVMVQGGYSARDTPIENFLVDRGKDNRALVAGVTFKRPESDQAFRFLKVSRNKAKGGSVLSIAAHLPARSSRLSQPRIAYGAMAQTAVRAKTAETTLNGKTLDEEGVAAALAVETNECDPLTDSFATAQYRRDVLPVYLKRLLLG